MIVQNTVNLNNNFAKEKATETNPWLNIKFLVEVNYNFSIAIFTLSIVLSLPRIAESSTPPPGVNCLPETATPVSYTHLDVYKRQENTYLIA